MKGFGILDKLKRQHESIALSQKYNPFLFFWEDTAEIDLHEINHKYLPINNKSN
jgi:hypothetical protein